MLVLVQNGLSVLDSYVNTKIDQSMVLDFRSDLFRHAQRLSLAFHDQRRSGMLIYAINFQADAVARVIMAIPPLAQSALTLVGMVWVSYTIDPTLSLLSLIVDHGLRRQSMSVKRLRAGRTGSPGGFGHRADFSGRSRRSAAAPVTRRPRPPSPGCVHARGRM